MGSIGTIGSLEDSIETIKPASEFIQDFSTLLKSKIENTNALMQEAGNLTKRFAMGENIGIHEITIASERASVALQLTMELRNRALDTYRELLRLQV